MPELSNIVYFVAVCVILALVARMYFGPSESKRETWPTWMYTDKNQRNAIIPTEPRGRTNVFALPHIQRPQLTTPSTTSTKLDSDETRALQSVKSWLQLM